jgi:hypothetical protein
MAYRFVAAAVLFVASTASAAKISVVVEGAGDRTGELAAALRKQLTAGGDELVDAGATATLLDDGAAAQLREKLDVARLMVATVQRQGKDRFLVTVRAADASGLQRRFGDASSDTLVDVVLKAAADLPPLPSPAVAAPTVTTPAPAAAETPKTDEAPPPAQVEPAKSSPSPSTKYRKHEYGMLIGGIVAFFVPWIATIGLAAHYTGYNANAARLGYIPVAGPYLARRKINDKDLNDGYDAGLTVDGVVQTIAASVLIAGILYCAIGVPTREAPRASVRPLFGLGRSGAQLGAEVRW